MNLRVELPPEVVDEIVERVTERVLASLRLSGSRLGSPWLYGAKAAADYLGWPLGRVEKLAAANAIPFRREGRRLIFNRTELDRYVAARGGAS